jgi:AmmeMemoRadiSam system protein B
MEALLAQKKRIRSPVGAGMFYPEEKKEMLDYLRSFGLEEANGGYAKALIAPHGAWNYSGALVASAFSSAMGRRDSIRRVVILGPIHDKREKGLFLSNSYSFHTPIGNIPVDREISEELEFHSHFFEINDIPHLSEHSIEILLPFVKYCFPDASIVPILMGQPKAQYIYDLAQALKTVITPVLDETLIVVSCNLSSDGDQKTARFLAEEVLRLFSEKNSPALASAILDGRLNACGGALAAGLFESGLLDETYTCTAAENMVSAVSAENNTVYYSELSYM